MKQIITLAILASAMIWNPAMAQKSNKFGHINSQELLPLFPEYKAAVAKMDSITKDIQKQLQEMMTEYRAKQEKYSSEAPKLSELVKKDKEEELTSLGTRIQNFQQQAEQSIQDQQQALTDPIVTKMRKTIEQVAKENGYTYIFDTSVGSLLFWEESDNILASVKKKLNLQ